MKTALQELLMRGWLRYLALGTASCFLLLGFLGEREPHVEITIEMRTRGGTDGELFYASKGASFSPQQSVPFEIERDGNWHVYRIPIPERVAVDRLRIDPGSTSGVIQIRRIGLITRNDETILDAKQLEDAVVSRNQMTKSAVNGYPGILSFDARAPDPFLEIQLPSQHLTRLPPIVRMTLYALGGAILSLCGLGLFWFFSVRAKALSAAIRGIGWLVALSNRLSDEQVLSVRPPMLIVVSAIVLSSTIYIIFGLHQSSIGVWEDMFPAKPIAQLVDLGTPKHIRSDEWNTQTPWALNQVQLKMPLRNDSIGGEQAPLLASVPVSHISGLAQVKFYGFRFLGLERGFSWWWAYKTFGLLLSCFWMLLILTRGSNAVSLLGAIWVYGSSAVQWWLSSNLPEILVSFCLAVIGANYLLFARKPMMVVVGAFLAAYAFINLLLHLYPPFIVPLAYLGIAILFGRILEPGAIESLKFGMRWRCVCAVSVFGLASIIAALYVIDALPTMKTMMATVYPGHRISASGDMATDRAIYGFFEAFRLGEGRLPLPPTNASEASSFVLLFPILLLIIPATKLFRRKNALLISLFTYCVVLSAWIGLSLPTPVEGVMQSIGWSWSPPSRSMLGLGLASVILVVLVLSRTGNEEADMASLDARKMIPLIVAAFLIPLGYAFHRIDPTFFTIPVIILGVVSCALITRGTALGRIVPFASGVAVLVTPALMVNPLISGLSAITEKPALIAAKAATTSKTDKWAVVGAFVFSQGLKAHGLDVITGSQLVPEIANSVKLDPGRKYEEVWNRYAHVVFRSEPGLREPTFDLKSPDLYVVNLDMCGPEIRALGITLVAYTEAVPAKDLSCLREVPSPSDSGVRMFRVYRSTGK